MTRGAQADRFREEVRAFVADYFPPSLRGADPLLFQGSAKAAAASPAFQAWRVAVADRGWGVPTWPVCYGGAGLSDAEAKVIGEEFAAAGAFNPIRSYGTMMLGPTLLEYGDEAQKAAHLPPIARHERRWCQGFSEPGAGSDLASLQTRCIADGDHWRVSGQKIWTSGADEADWCFALVRTDTTRKHGGISFLLIDMTSPGIAVRPIVLISGSTHFSEVFFDDVAVPLGNLVGGAGNGWGIAKRLLQFERDSLAVGRGKLPSLADEARAAIGVDAEGRIDDPDLRVRLIGNAMRGAAFTHLLSRAAAEAKAGGGLGAGVSAVKNLWSDIAQERAELALEVGGADATGWSGEAYDPKQIAATRAWLHSKAFSIYGGSREVQANIVAKRVLGLPGHD